MNIISHSSKGQKCRSSLAGWFWIRSPMRLSVSQGCGHLKAWLGWEEPRPRQLTQHSGQAGAPVNRTPQFLSMWLSVLLCRAAWVCSQHGADFPKSKRPTPQGTSHFCHTVFSQSESLSQAYIWGMGLRPYLLKKESQGTGWHSLKASHTPMGKWTKDREFR